MIKTLLRLLGLVRNTDPQVKVIGIYEVRGKSYSLIEILIKGSTGPFDINGFTQEWPTVPRSNWPRPYMAKFLSSDGNKVIADIVPGTFTDSSIWMGDIRICFFFNFPAYEIPLLTPWGSTRLPELTPRPKRLLMVRYKQKE